MLRKIITQLVFSKIKGLIKPSMKNFFSLLYHILILLLAVSVYSYGLDIEAREKRRSFSLPDLTGEWISLTQNCKNSDRGTKCQIDGIINFENQGFKNSSSFGVNFYLSDDDSFDENDLFLRQLKTGNIKGGKDKTRKLSYFFPSEQMATCKYIIAVIDEDDSVPEIDETNNIIISERIYPGIQPNYSGMYYVTLGPDPRFRMNLEQSDHNVTFVVESSRFRAEGTGTACSARMDLTSEIEGMGEWVAGITFSNDGDRFSGVWEMIGGLPIQGTVTGTKCGWSTYDIGLYGIPQFINENFIELEKIQKVSKFRSGEGHDYSDDFERCRSMKHYFYPKEGVDRSTVRLFSPVDGTVIGMTEEWESPELWKGTLVGIAPNGYEGFWINIFHINLNQPLRVGDTVTAGQELGRSAKIDGTVTDIAVWVHTPDGDKLISYFEAMTDSVFHDYQDRGLNFREDAIITKEERDTDPLTCDGEQFLDGGHLDNWVILN